VLVKELRTRMRGARAYWIVLVYVGCLAVVLLANYYPAATGPAPVGGGAPAGVSASQLGQRIFTYVFCIQGILIALITPAMTAGSITTEREQRSYDLLRTTPLSAGGVIRGKLGAAVLFVGLLLTATLPVASISLLLGGVSPAEIGSTYLVLGATITTFGAVGLFWSALAPRTAPATAGAYVSAAAFFLATLAIGVVATSPGAPLPFRSANGAMAPFHAARPELFFARTIPSCLPAVSLNGLLAALLALAAAERLEGFNPPGPALRRGVATLLWAVLWTGIVGTVVGALFFGPSNGWQASLAALPSAPPPGQAPGAAAVRLVLAAVAVGVWAALAAVAPLFVTDDGRARSGRPRCRDRLDGLDPRAWFSDRPAGGPGLMALWTALPLLLLVGGTALAGHGALANARPVLVGAAAVLGAFTLASTGMGRLCSAASRHRWRAAGWTYLVLFILSIGPIALLGERNWEPPGSHARPWVLAATYLAPTEALRQLAAVGFEPRMTPALSDRVPHWAVTAALYAALGLLALAGAALLRARAGVDARSESHL
jgi:ABC-type transport system involved in multi-copper enzyme maturation permease subunit